MAAEHKKKFGREPFFPNDGFFCTKGYKDVPRGVRVTEKYKEPEMMGEDKVYDTVVVGQGWSGLMALKYQLQEGLSAIGVEREESIGGIWQFDEKRPYGVARSTQMSSSLTMTECSDFAFSHVHTNFPVWKQVMEYLNDYVKFFGLAPHQKFNFCVQKVMKEGNLWVVKSADGSVVKGKHLIISIGANEIPRTREDFGDFFKDFKGKCIHSSEYKQPVNDFDAKRVLIMGGGESGAEMANEISFHALKCYLSIPNGQWFTPRYNEYGRTFPLDYYSTRMERWLLPGNKYPFMYEALRKGQELKFGLQGHGQICWKTPHHDYGTSPITRSSDVMRRIIMGQVQPKGKIVKIENGNNFHFSDGSVAENIDILVLATGYKIVLPMLEKDSDFCISKCYKMVLDNDDDTLAYVGFVRPVRGSYIPIAESQSRLLSKYWSNQITLPNKQERAAIAKQEQAQRDEFFRGSNKRIRTLVDMFEYNDDVNALAGLKPNYLAILQSNGLKEFWQLVSAPYHGSQFYINDSRYYKHILARTHYFKAGNPNTPFQIFFHTIFSHFYWIMNELSKYPFVFVPMKYLLFGIIFYFVVSRM